MTVPIERACGTWPSPITPEFAAAAGGALAHPQRDGEMLYWLETRPAEGGRNTLVERGPDGQLRDLLPPPINVRSQVHEYGGRPFVVADGMLYFVLRDDQRLYRLNLGDPRALPVPLTPDHRGLRFAEPVVDRARQRLLAICEWHREGRHSAEPENFIAAVPFAGGEVEPLLRGADFYAGPSLDPEGNRLAWLSWNHPDMPWDGAELWIAELDQAGRCSGARRIAGGHGEAVFQPGWLGDRRLIYSCDRSGWWNLHSWQGHGDGAPLAAMAAEFGAPLWTLGMSVWAPGEQRITACYSQDGRWHLGILETRTGTLTEIDTPYSEFRDLSGCGDQAYCIAAGPDRGDELLEIDVRSGRWRRLHAVGGPTLDPGFAPAPEAFRYATGDGASAHGFYYAPAHPDYRPRAGERPPLIALCHGGPTGATSTAWNPKVRFWTSRGFAVADFNYRGSTGYGRAYREALNGNWGLFDIEDLVAGVHHLAAAGRADPDRLLIRGSSAGGYTVLAALTFTTAFRAGASLYGIGDLERLARDTHKFESRYLDRLIGPWPEASERYRARSPLHHAEQMRCPVIFFQGLDDKVVPPDQTLAMVEALRKRDLPVTYVPFPGEGHGFRRPENVARVFREELAFYRRVLGLDGGA